jgi:NAD(P)H-nitrite reductase large subunit
MICFCYSVPESVIVKAIEDGAETLMDIRRLTYANTGCAGCMNEVKKILDKHVPRVRAKKAAGGGEGQNG